MPGEIENWDQPSEACEASVDEAGPLHAVDASLAPTRVEDDEGHEDT